MQHKISVLAEGNVHFKEKLVQLYIRSFQELKDTFKTIIINQDTKTLTFINHKYRTTFLMFDLQELAAEVEKGKSMLEAGISDLINMNEVIASVEAYCTEILEELNEADN